MRPVLSIIVPVYNTEQYLSKCIESIIQQSYQQFELLLINDGSTDGSGSICDAYSAKDGRIKVMHKANGGVSSARNLGLDLAIGEWVMFVDSDDSLPKSAIENHMNSVSEFVDMSMGSLMKVDNDYNELETIKEEKRIVSVEQIVEDFIAPDQWDKDWHRYIGNRLFRKSVIDSNSLRFKEDIYYKEDGLFILMFLYSCTRQVACIPEVVYYYNQVPNSALGSLNTSFNPRVLSIIDAHGEIYKELLRRKAPKNVIERELRHLFRNYPWISSMMKDAGVYNAKNKHNLRVKMINNGGLINFIEYVTIPHLFQAVKRRLYK